MNTDDGLDFDVYFNNKQFNKAVDEAEKRVKGFSAATVAEGQKIDDAFKITADNIRIQKDVIAKLETELNNLNIEISKMKPGPAQSQMKQAAKEVAAELKAEKDALKMLEGQVKQTEDKTVSFRTQLRNAREELIRMEQAGMRNTEAYRKLQLELGNLQDAYDDATQQARVLANDERVFQGIISTMSGVTGAFSAAQGAVGMFSGENENLQRIMLKVQSLMSITIGLQQVAVMLNKDSYFSIVVLTKAKELWAIANLKVATTLGITTAAAQALMITLTFGLSVAITAVVAGLSILVSRSGQARKEIKAMNEAIVENSFQSIASIQQLSTEWNSLGNNIQAKEKFIEDNKKKFEDLGVSINSVRDAENLLVKNKEKFIESVMLKAKALAAADLAAQKYKDALLKRQKLEGMQEYETVGYNDPATGEYKTYQRKTRRYSKIEEDAEELEKAGADWIKKATRFTDAEKAILQSIGVSSEGVIEGIIANLEANIAKLKEKQKKAKTDKEIQDLQKQIDEQEKLLAGKTGKGSKNAEEERKKAAEELKKNLKEQSELRRDLLSKENEMAIDSMRDGFDKEMAELKFEHKQKLDEIKKYEERLLEIQNEVAKNEWVKSGKKESTFKASSTLNASDTGTIKSLIAAEEKRYANAQGGVYEALFEKYQTFDEKKKKLDEEYFDEYMRLYALMDGKNTAQIIAKQKALKKMWADDIKELQLSILKDYNLDGLLTNASGYLMDKVKEVLPFFHSISEASAGELKKIKEVINSIEIPQKVVDELKEKGVDTQMLFDLINNLQKAVDQGEGQIQEALINKYVDAAKQFGSVLSQSGDEFVQKVGNLISQLGSTVGTLTSNTATSFDKASSIISLVITVGNYLKSIRLDEEAKEINAKKDISNEVARQVGYETEINRILAERKALQNDNIFLGKNYSAVMSDAMSNIYKYNDQLSGTLDSLFNSSIFSADGKAKRALFGTKKGTYEFTLADILRGLAPEVNKDNVDKNFFGVGLGIPETIISIKAFKKLFEGDLSGIGNMLDPLHIFGGGKADQKAKLDAFNTLTKAVKDSLAAMGKSVADFATMSNEDMLTFFELMEKSGNITDEGTKKLLASAKEQLEMIKKAQEEMKAAIGEIAGSIGQTIQDILEDAFVNGFAYGPEQARKVSKEISKILEDMLSSMIYQQAFASLFNDLQAGMEKSFGVDGDKSWIDDFATFMQGIPGAAAMFNEGMKQAQEAAKKAGFDLWGKGADSSLSGAIKGITSEQASILTGQTNAMRINQVESIQILRNQLLALNTIAQNTSHNVHLTKLNDILDVLKSKQTDPLRGQGL